MNNITEYFKFDPLTSFFLVCAILFVLVGILAPILNKKSAVTIAASTSTGILGGIYFLFCIGVLNMLESNADYGLPINYLTDQRDTYTTMVMVIIFVLALIGIALSILCAFGKIKIHKNKLFNMYAIVSVVSFVTIGVSLFTSYSQYMILVVFLPLNCILPLLLAALNMQECNTITQAVKIGVVLGGYLGVSIFLIVTTTYSAITLTMIIAAILVIPLVLSIISLVCEIKKARKSGGISNPFNSIKER